MEAHGHSVLVKVNSHRYRFIKSADWPTSVNAQTKMSVKPFMSLSEYDQFVWGEAQQSDA